MLKNIITVLFIFYVAGALAVATSFLYGHRGGGYASRVIFSQAIERGVYWPADFLRDAF